MYCRRLLAKMTPGLRDRTGDVYGRLTVVSRSVNDQYGNSQWLCSCTCGNKKIVNACALQQGDTKSCGCYHSSLRPFESLYNRLKTSTKHPVTLTYEEF